jgi:Protein of unknown function (DUF3318)
MIFEVQPIAVVKLMSSQTSELAESLEIQRLESRLPAGLRSCATFARSSQSGSAVIATEKTGKNQFLIKIDWSQWHQLSLNQRDLLLWHEVSRIQTDSIVHFSWEPIVMVTSLSVAWIEILSQNFLSLSFALVAIGLAGNQLYQRQRGERSLRASARADQNAIALAIQFGYSASQAHHSLQEALKILIRKTPQNAHWRRYQVRLTVLDFSAETGKIS